MLKINNIHFSFGEHQVLKGLNLDCAAGKIHGILGLNGAGKTTFFRTLYGFYPLQKGEILWNESAVQRNDISFLETENYFYPCTKGIEYIQLTTAMKVSEQQIRDWNELFELPLDDLIDSYSTGMRKKVAFLACLLQNRPLLVLDEPFNGIDLESSERLFAILKKLRDNGKTIVLSSHILSSLTNICDYIHHLQEGNFSNTYQRNDFDDFAKKIQNHIGEKIEQHLNILM